MLMMKPPTGPAASHRRLPVWIIAAGLLTTLGGVEPAIRTAATSGDDASAATARPLWLHPTNPRYFTDGRTNHDGSLKAVYLTGSHTWANLIDRGPSDPPPVFDFDWYLDFLGKHG